MISMILLRIFSFPIVAVVRLGITGTLNLSLIFTHQKSSTKDLVTEDMQCFYISYPKNTERVANLIEDAQILLWYYKI